MVSEGVVTSFRSNPSLTRYGRDGIARVVLSLLAVTWLVAAPPSVASLPWNAVNVKPELAVFYADALAEALRKQGLKVFTSADVVALIGQERQRQLLGCGENSASCMVELANALGCDATLVVNGARFDDGGFRGIVKVLGKDGSVLSSYSLDARSERGLLDAIDAAAEPLAAPLLPKVERRKPDFAQKWWIPGIATVVAAGVGGGMLLGAKGEYDRVLTQPTQTEGAAVAQSGKGLQTGGFVLLGVGGGLLVATAVLALWPEAPVTPSLSVTTQGASAGIGGAF